MAGQRGPGGAWPRLASAWGSLCHPLALAAPSLSAVLTEPWWGHLVRQVTAVMGVGSVVFHATLRYAAQLFDELPLYAMALLAALTLPLPLPLTLTLTLTLTR